MNFSIITAAYRAELLDRAWSSIKNQTHTGWEWILVNDGQQAVRDWYQAKRKSGEFDQYNIWMVDCEINLGRFGLYARNIGAMAAGYNNIVYLDDDNEWLPNHLQSFADIYERTGKIPYCWLHIKGKKPGSTFERIKPTHFHRQGIDLGCVMYRRSHFERFGYFRDDAQITYDWNAMERIFNGLGGQEAFLCTEQPTLIFHHKRY